jgi:hypothetical protein
MKDRARLIVWDSAFLVGIGLFFFWNIPPHYNLIVGFLTTLIMSNCVANHIAAYKLNGKIY